MNKNIIYGIALMLVVTILNVCDSVETDIIFNEYDDPVINMLLNGESLEYEQKEELGEQPIFNEGMWKCGVCDVLDERKLINRDFYSVDKNVDDNLFQVQVGLALEHSKCVTITADSDIVVHLVSGACDGTYVTFNIGHATNFSVNVYSF